MTTREITRGFFPAEDVTRRRLRRLAGWDLIRSHRKGLDASVRYEAWRLTAVGLDLVTEEFHDELVPDGLCDRLAEGTLLHINHREAVSRVYLGLLHGREGSIEPGGWTAVNGQIARLRARASKFTWQADGDVTLRYHTLVEEQQVVPDATITARHQPARVFVEVDRSTKALARIGSVMERYRRFVTTEYPRTFPDGKKAIVLFVVRSAARRDGIARLAERTLPPVAWVSLLESDATAWLEEQVLGAAPKPDREEPIKEAPDPRLEPLRNLTTEVYRWARGYQKQLLGEGRDLPREGQVILRRLFDELSRAGEGSHEG